MKIGDLVRMKRNIQASSYFSEIGVVIGVDDSPWESCVRICWYTMEGSGNHNALHRIYDLEPAF